MNPSSSLTGSISRLLVPAAFCGALFIGACSEKIDQPALRPALNTSGTDASLFKRNHVLKAYQQVYPRLKLMSIEQLGDGKFKVTIAGVGDGGMKRKIEEDLESAVLEELRVGRSTVQMRTATGERASIIVENMPSPLGGMASFEQYVRGNLKMPKEAKLKHVAGRVLVEFIVYKDGSIREVKVAKGLGMGCDEEAVRLMKSSPKWKFGQQAGQAANVKMYLPIDFNASAHL